MENFVAGLDSKATPKKSVTLSGLCVMRKLRIRGNKTNKMQTKSATKEKSVSSISSANIILPLRERIRELVTLIRTRRLYEKGKPQLQS